jgi:basic amino acid/polyamine antiporter, APA family
MSISVVNKTSLKDTERSYSTIGSKKISVTDAIAIVIGMVIGPGIFKTPSIVAANSSGELMVLSFWALGGLVSLIGALCYAELTTAYPHAGGEYHYLVRSFGKKMSFLFAWARMTVIQTGSIAILAFLIGDYASEAFYIGTYSSSIYAALTVVILTAINLKGIRSSSTLQKFLMSGILFGLLTIIAIGLFSSPAAAVSSGSISSNAALGQAMIFVLLTYGGWNEAAYLSSEVSNKKAGIIKVLFYSIGLITFIYLLTNFALLRGLGFENLANSQAVASDLISNVLGENWVKLISIIISVAAFSTVNAVMITGARTNYALGKDFGLFNFLSHQNKNQKAPANAFLFQSAIALLLVAIGTATRSGFVTMVEYTAPVFWFFFLMVGLSIFILRSKEREVERPFRVPFYPVTPLLFCLASAYMLYSSLMYTGIGALIGVAVLVAGLPFIFLKNNNKNEEN